MVSTFLWCIEFAAESEFLHAPALFDVYKNGNYDDVPLKRNFARWKLKSENNDLLKTIIVLGIPFIKIAINFFLSIIIVTETKGSNHIWLQI